jgi:hypothetical protein
MTVRGRSERRPGRGGGKVSALPVIAILLSTSVPAAAQRMDMELACRPEYGLLDDRPQRPNDVRGHSPSSTYYLFDNPQLFEYRVSLMNVSPQPLPLLVASGERAADWAAALRLRIERDGVPLGERDVRVQPVRRLLRRVVYLRDGHPIADPRFVRRSAGAGSDPIMPFDDYRHEEEVVDIVPSQLATYEEAVAILRVSAYDGADLPLGLYTVRIADEANAARCFEDQLVVMREPRSPLDTVDAHIVRANADQAAGDLEAGARELARATEVAPDNIKGWVYRALALAREDLAGQAEAATRLEALLATPAEAPREEFVGVLRDAQAIAASAPELRRALAEAATAKP